MIATQHSGSGKANQYFLRGFNLDHGTDFATRVDGVPINMPTHGHGQGYTDLSFLIPELVERIDYKLYSSFTYFLGDLQLGDQFQQVDRRTVAGARLEYQSLSRLLGFPLENWTGVEYRLDFIDNGLYSSFRRLRLSQQRRARFDRPHGLGAGSGAELRRGGRRAP